MPPTTQQVIDALEEMQNCPIPIGYKAIAESAAKEIHRLRKALKEIADDGKNCEGYCRRQAARAIRPRS